MKFLFLGNDPHLNTVNWDLVENSTLTVVGINRSYLLYPKQDILFMQDPKTFLELLDNIESNDTIKSYNVCTTRYFKRRLMKERGQRGKKAVLSPEDYSKVIEALAGELITVRESNTKIPHHAPFSMINAMTYCFDFYANEIKKSGECVFYLYGCQLKHRPDNNHFWKSDGVTIRYPKNSPGGSNRLQLVRQLHVFKRIKPIFDALILKLFLVMRLQS